MPEEERKVERPPRNMYRRAALAIVLAWMAKTRSAYPIILALKVVAAVAFVGAAGAAIFLIVPNNVLVPSSNYRKAIAAVLIAWSAKTRSFDPIILALKAAGACAFLVVGFFILLAIGAVLVFKYGPPEEEEKRHRMREAPPARRATSTRRMKRSARSWATTLILTSKDCWTACPRSTV